MPNKKAIRLANKAKVRELNRLKRDSDRLLTEKEIISKNKDPRISEINKEIASKNSFILFQCLNLSTLYRYQISKRHEEEKLRCIEDIEQIEYEKKHGEQYHIVNHVRFIEEQITETLHLIEANRMQSHESEMFIRTTRPFLYDMMEDDEKKFTRRFKHITKLLEKMFSPHINEHNKNESKVRASVFDFI